MTGFVYFMRAKAAVGPVKIGWSKTPSVRLRSYNAISPFELEIVALTPGPLALENKLQAMFAKDRSHHEWFRPSAALHAIIDEIRSGTFDPAHIPSAKNEYRSDGAKKGWAARRAA